MKSLIYFLKGHGTKALGFMQVTVAVLAAATDMFTPQVIKIFMLANGLLVVWRGFFNSTKGTTP